MSKILVIFDVELPQKDSMSAEIVVIISDVLTTF